MSIVHRLYTDLADWWPLISPVAQYAQDAEQVAAVLASAAAPVREVLDLGGGGGHLAAHLKGRLALTLVDLSPQMLAVSQRLNPECVHRQGDMRTIRLGRAFDAVLAHDAVDYATTEHDLAQVIQTAFAHCRPGGIAVFAPDFTAETFRARHRRGGSGDGAGRRGSFTEWTWDPDPADGWVQSEYEFVLRSADGGVEVVRETHRLAAFSRATWLRLLAEAGFEPQERPGRPSAASREADGGWPSPSLFAGRRR